MALRITIYVFRYINFAGQDIYTKDNWPIWKYKKLCLLKGITKVYHKTHKVIAKWIWPQTGWSFVGWGCIPFNQYISGGCAGGCCVSVEYDYNCHLKLMPEIGNNVHKISNNASPEIDDCHFCAAVKGITAGGKCEWKVFHLWNWQYRPPHPPIITSFMSNSTLLVMIMVVMSDWGSKLNIVCAHCRLQERLKADHLLQGFCGTNTYLIKCKHYEISKGTFNCLSTLACFNTM